MDERPGFGLYVHWPFCQAKCPYCDFNSHVSKTVNQTRWKGALLSEIKRLSEETRGRVLDSIFFGGGTPSLMNPDTVAAVIDGAKTAWHASNQIEITLEANPTSVEAKKFEAFRAAGVNRVSVGIQALNNRDLKALGRLHTVQEARFAFEIARSTFDRCSFDLIYARQNQSLQDWEKELKDALNFADGHLSLYQLTIEENTAFGDRFARGGLAGLPVEDLAADMFDLTQEMTSAAGLPSYEISNHAKPGQESRHNMIYWQSGDWVAVGPGAHGRHSSADGRIATEAYRMPSEWLNRVEANGTGESLRTYLTCSQEFEERVMMGLRLTNGLPISLVSEENLIRKINNLSEIKLLTVTDDRIRLTAKGRPLLNAILQEILV